MRCRKCKGLMVAEWVRDVFPEPQIWRCMNCGLMMDTTIARNRSFVMQQARAATRAPSDSRQRDRDLAYCE